MTTNGTNGHSGANGHRVNGESGPQPLNIAIIGAGIGGLAVAIGLRRQGHNVSLYEQSRFATETGAAIHLAPNANGILRRWGLKAEEFGAVANEAIWEYGAENSLHRHLDFKEANKVWQHPWQAVHRVRLHDALKRAAISEAGAALHLRKRVATVDAESVTIKFEDGEEAKADLIIGADGIYSKTREVVAEKPVELVSSGKSAFRFLIPTQTIRENPLTAKFAENINGLSLWLSTDRRLIMYPCNSNDEMNFVAIHPENESHATASDEWNKQGSLEQLLKVYQNWDPSVLALLGMANPESLKVWQLLDMEVLPSWVKGKLALLGDAAHPFLPHQGQGGGIAIEDAAALATVLPLGVTTEEVHERLKLYEEIRYTRANTIQEYSRLAGKDLVPGEPKLQVERYTAYNFGHCEIDNSSQKLKKWLYAKNPNLTWRTPLGFGPAPGPRQDLHGNAWAASQQTFSKATIRFKTSRTFLQNLLPSDSYCFQSPATVAEASFTVTTLHNVPWLGGRAENIFGLYIHGVQYVKKDGSKVPGSYIPVVFDDQADGAIIGREGYGMPGLWCSISIDRQSDTWSMQASWHGAKFADFRLGGLQSVDPEIEQACKEEENHSNVLMHRYIPAVGEPGKADEYPVVMARETGFALGASTIRKMEKTREAEVKIDAQDWKALPTLHHVASVLAEIPIYGVVEGTLAEGSGVPNISSAKRVE